MRVHSLDTIPHLLRQLLVTFTKTVLKSPLGWVGLFCRNKLLKFHKHCKIDTRPELLPSERFKLGEHLLCHYAHCQRQMAHYKMLNEHLSISISCTSVQVFEFQNRNCYSHAFFLPIFLSSPITLPPPPTLLPLRVNPA